MLPNKKLLPVLALLLALLLAAGCGQAAAPAQSPAASVPDSSQSAPAAEADRTAQVFDTSGDAGKLTARFIQLTSTDPETKAGDSTIITFPDGKVMLLDAGSPTCAPNVLDALQAMGVTKLDAILNSHPHVDHCGAIPAVVEALPVDVIYKSALQYPKGPAQDFEGAIAKKNLEVITLKEGDSFEFGGCQIEIFNPPAEFTYPDNYPTGATQFVNNNSIVMKITYGESTMLFGGDLYVPGEEELMQRYGDKLRADVMKANHHGDSTSNARDYIETVQPKVCVIMHDAIASTDIYKAYRKRGADVYHTLLDGCVAVSADDKASYTVITQFDRKSDFLK